MGAVLCSVCSSWKIKIVMKCVCLLTFAIVVVCIQQSFAGKGGEEKGGESRTTQYCKGKVSVGNWANPLFFKWGTVITCDEGSDYDQCFTTECVTEKKKPVWKTETDMSCPSCTYNGVTFPLDTVRMCKHTAPAPCYCEVCRQEIRYMVTDGVHVAIRDEPKFVKEGLACDCTY